MTYDGIEIEVTNWETYNPRKDLKKPSWFRLENDLLTGSKYFDLSPTEKLLMVLIFSLVSQANGKPITLSYRYLKMFTELENDAITKTIDFIIQKGTVRLTRTESVRTRTESEQICTQPEQIRTESGPICTLRDETRRDERNETGRDVTRRDERDGTRRDETARSWAPEPPPPQELNLIGEELKIRGVKFLLMTQWLQTYPDPGWITQEVRKAFSWEMANPKRRKKDFGRFMTNWLAKGWDRRQLPGRVQNSAEDRSRSNQEAVDAVKARIKNYREGIQA